MLSGYQILCLMSVVSSMIYATPTVTFLSDQRTRAQAVYDGLTGDWQSARKKLVDLMAAQESPYECADLLFDAGVAAYRAQEYEQALSYFKDVEKCADGQPLLERALFNGGNAALMLKRYDEAIDLYDKVIERNQSHERALHNREYAKKMRDQERAKQEQQDKHDQEQKEQQEKQDNQDSQNQNSNSSQDDKQQQNQDGQQDNHGKGSDKSDASKSSDSGSENGDNRNGDSSQQNEGEQEHAQDQGTQRPDNRSQQSGTDTENADKKHNDSKKQGKQNHAAGVNKSERPAGGQDKKEAAQGQGAEEEGSVAPQQLVPEKKDWMMQLLEQQEMLDKEGQKRHMKALAGKKASTHNGQNNW